MEYGIAGVLHEFAARRFIDYLYKAARTVILVLVPQNSHATCPNCSENLGLSKIPIKKTNQKWIASLKL